MRHFFGQLAGESYRNADGSDRQAIIPKCEVGELLVLEHEPDNPHDINAIRVLRESGEQIGYLPRHFAAEVVSRSAKGWQYYAAVAGIGRAEGGYGPYGVSLLIIVDESPLDRRDLSSHVLRALEERLGRSPRRANLEVVVRVRGEAPAAPENASAPADPGARWVWGAVLVAMVIAAVVLIRVLTQ